MTSKTLALAAALAALALLVPPAVVAADDTPPAVAAEASDSAVAAEAGDSTAAKTRTLTGQFDWSGRDATGDLKAIFTATGDNAWTVDFHFVFRDEPHVYSGTADGNLKDGKLAGTVQNENKKRTWTFTGEFDETGAFKGTHSEIDDGEAHPTGAMNLRPASAS